jgi:hypothetical protein
MLHYNTISICYTVIVKSENGRKVKFRGNHLPLHGLHIVRSVAGDETWRALWDWLLAPESPTEPVARESEIADDDSQTSHNNSRSSREHNKEG